MLKKAVPAHKGSLLLEVLIASGVLAVSLSALIFFFVSSVALNENSRNTTTALSHVQYVLEDIRSQTYANAVTQLTANAWSWDSAAINALNLTPLRNETVKTSATGTGPLTVNTTVEWQDTNQRTRQLSVLTIVGGS